MAGVFIVAHLHMRPAHARQKLPVHAAQIVAGLVDAAFGVVHAAPGLRLRALRSGCDAPAD